MGSAIYSKAEKVSKAMAGFFSSVFKSHQVNDGTRRAAMETVISAREDLQAAGNRLNDTIRDLMREQDRVTKRQRKNEKPNP